MVYLWKCYDDSSKQGCSWLYILPPDEADGTKRATFLTSHLPQKRPAAVTFGLTAVLDLCRNMS